MHSCSITMAWWWPILEVEPRCQIMNSKNSELRVTENIFTYLRRFSLWPHVQIDSEAIHRPIQPRPAILTRTKVRTWQLISIWSQNHEFMESHLLSTFIIMVELLITGTNFPSQYMYFRTIFERQDFRLPPQCSWSLGCWRRIVW